MLIFFTSMLSVQIILSLMVISISWNSPILIESPPKTPDLPIIFSRLLFPIENISLLFNMLSGTEKYVKN